MRALRSGVVHVLGHPTGRELGTRDAYALDLERVLEVARSEGVALEMNAMPERLDLTDVGCRAAKAAGVPGWRGEVRLTEAPHGGERCRRRSS